MIEDKSFLSDYAFLKDFDKLRNKRQYARITVLDYNEKPLEFIEGRIQPGGSISLQSGSLRCTASFTLVAKLDEKNKLLDFNNLLSINRKVKLELGFENDLKESYAKYSKLDMLWFPIGVMIIQSPSFSHSLTEISISLSLQDKMCLLNGTCGGTFYADVDLDTKETMIEVSDSETDTAADETTNEESLEYYATEVKVPVADVIRELMNHWGGEQLRNIVIEDIPEKSMCLRSLGSTKISNKKLDLERVYENEDTYLKPILYDYDDSAPNAYAEFYLGDAIGFTYEDTVLPNTLTASAGDNIASILDKINESLGGNYEFFYDRDGVFHFREIKNYLNNSKSSYTTYELLTDPTQKVDYTRDIRKGKSAYSFEDLSLIVSVNNSPVYEEVKNDFTVWGKTSDSETDIRYHLIIDDSVSFDEDREYLNNHFILRQISTGDWKVYPLYVYEKKSDFPTYGLTDAVYYAIADKDKEKTYVRVWNGYSYPKIEVTEDNFQFIHNTDLSDVNSQNTFSISKEDWRLILMLDGIEDSRLGLESNDYYEELFAELYKIYDFSLPYPEYWVIKKYIDYPYFIDFLDSPALETLKVSNLGHRVEVLNGSDDGVNCLFETDTPNYAYYFYSSEDYSTIEDVIKSEEFQEYEDELLDNFGGEENPHIVFVDTENKDYLFMNINMMASDNSAYNYIMNMLYTYVQPTASINLETVPIYYLEPNTRISVSDSSSNVSGDYIISEISIPIDADGTMSITASKAMDRLENIENIESKKEEIVY